MDKEILEIQSQMRELIVNHILNDEPIIRPEYVQELIQRSDEWWAKYEER